MKKLADRCTKASTILLFIVTIPVFFPYTDLFHRFPILAGILLLPSTIFSAIAAVIHHKLPPNQREPLDVSWWGLRLHISHPYWHLLITASLNILYFLTALEDTPFALPLIILLAFTFLFAQVFAVGYDWWRNKYSKSQKKKHPK